MAAAAAGMHRAEIATTFRVSAAPIRRWRRRQRERGALTADASPGRPPTITPEHLALLRAQLEAHPDATIAWHAQQWHRAHSTTLSQWAVGRVMRRLGWTRKTSP